MSRAAKLCYCKYTLSSESLEHTRQLRSPWTLTWILTDSIECRQSAKTLYIQGLIIFDGRQLLYSNNV